MKLNLNEGNDQFKDLYELIHRFATGDQVKALLRKHKTDLPKEAHADVRLSADTTKNLCHENLRKAVTTKHVPISEVYDLLRDCEENGAQHLFLFEPKNAKAAKLLNAPEDIAERMFGTQWKIKFPRTHLEPNDFAWSDFRVRGKRGWIAKAYLHSVVEEKTETFQDKSDENVRWEKFEKFNQRSICMAVWSSDLSIFQIRIGNELDVPIVLSMFLDRLRKGGLDVNDIASPLNLGPARANLLAQAEKNKDTYECGAFRSIDKERYRIEGSPYTQDPDESPTATAFCKEILRQIAQSPETDKYSLVVYWKPNDSFLKSSLRCEVGTKKNPHEAVINARTTPQAIQYVLEKLVEFSK
jgi:hypothetical protein